MKRAHCILFGLLGIGRSAAFETGRGGASSSLSFFKVFSYNRKVARHRMGAFLGCDGMGTGWDDVCPRVNVHMRDTQALFHVFRGYCSGRGLDGLSVFRDGNMRVPLLLLLLPLPRSRSWLYLHQLDGRSVNCKTCDYALTFMA